MVSDDFALWKKSLKTTAQNPKETKDLISHELTIALFLSFCQISVPCYLINILCTLYVQNYHIVIGADFAPNKSNKCALSANNCALLLLLISKFSQ